MGKKPIVSTAEFFRSYDGEWTPHRLSMELDRARRLLRVLEVAVQYSNRIPLEQICVNYSVSRSTVLRIARMAKLPKRGKGFDPEIRELVIQDYKQGLSVEEISSLRNVSQAYVSKTAQEENIGRYNTGEARGTNPSKDETSTG